MTADPDDSPLAALTQSANLTEPLQVAALWWLAVLDPRQHHEELTWLTHAPEAWGDFQWATDLLTDMSIASKVSVAMEKSPLVAM